MNLIKNYNLKIGELYYFGTYAGDIVTTTCDKSIAHKFSSIKAARKKRDELIKNRVYAEIVTVN